MEGINNADLAGYISQYNIHEIQVHQSFTIFLKPKCSSLAADILSANVAGGSQL